MPESRLNEVSIYAFVDYDIARDNSSSRNQRGVLIFNNKSPFRWYSNSQANAQAINFGAELYAMKKGMEMFDTLSYKLKMFGVPRVI